MSGKRNTIEAVMARLKWGVNGCLEWTGRKCRQGYGRVDYKGKNNRLVHKVLFEDQCGPVPEGKELHHWCANKACANLDHVELVTPRQHQMLEKPWRLQVLGQRQRDKTHCPKGHPYSGSNLRIDSRNKRVCIACKVERDRDYYRGTRSKFGIQPRDIKIQPEDREKIRNLRRDGWTIADLAVSYGVTTTHIYRILK